MGMGWEKKHPGNFFGRWSGVRVREGKFRLGIGKKIPDGEGGEALEKGRIQEKRGLKGLWELFPPLILGGGFLASLETPKQMQAAAKGFWDVLNP